MITVTIEKKYGASKATTIKARISAPTIESALELAGPNARVAFPIDGEMFFAPTGEAKDEAKGEAGEGIDYASMSQEDIETAYDAGLPGSYEAYLGMLKDDLGADAFEQYALENCLI